MHSLKVAGDVRRGPAGHCLGGSHLEAQSYSCEEFCKTHPSEPRELARVELPGVVRCVEWAGAGSCLFSFAWLLSCDAVSCLVEILLSSWCQCLGRKRTLRAHPLAAAFAMCLLQNSCESSLRTAHNRFGAHPPALSAGCLEDVGNTLMLQLAHNLLEGVAF